LRLGRRRGYQSLASSATSDAQHLSSDLMCSRRPSETIRSEPPRRIMTCGVQRQLHRLVETVYGIASANNKRRTWPLDRKWRGYIKGECWLPERIALHKSSGETGDETTHDLRTETNSGIAKCICNARIVQRESVEMEAGEIFFSFSPAVQRRSLSLHGRPECSPAMG
jgi:hypothetical protein